MDENKCGLSEEDRLEALQEEALRTKPGAAIEEPHQIEGCKVDDPKTVEEIQDTVEELGVGPDTRERG